MSFQGLATILGGSGFGLKEAPLRIRWIAFDGLVMNGWIGLRARPRCRGWLRFILDITFLEVRRREPTWATHSTRWSGFASSAFLNRAWNRLRQLYAGGRLSSHVGHPNAFTRSRAPENGTRFARNPQKRPGLSRTVSTGQALGSPPLPLDQFIHPP